MTRDASSFPILPATDSAPAPRLAHAINATSEAAAALPAHASGATTCPHLLRHPHLGVRPPGEPLPRTLPAGGALAEQFRRWLRQRDDAAHAAEKPMLVRALSALPDDAVRAEARRQAALAWAPDASAAQRQASASADRSTHAGPSLSTWCIPSATVAALLGMDIASVADQHRLHLRLRAIAAALAADASRDDVHHGDAATQALLDALQQAEQAAPTAPLATALRAHVSKHDGPDRTSFAANRLALLWQSHEAGAALLGHALLVFGHGVSPPTLTELRVLAGQGGGVRLTKRFAQCDMTLDGRSLQRSDAVTVPLQGAEEAFGLGAHRCPGERLALLTVQAALAWWLAQPSRPRWRSVEPLRLPNMEIPQCQFFDAPEATP